MSALVFFARRAAPYLAALALAVVLWSLWRQVVVQRQMISDQRVLLEQASENIQMLVVLNEGQAVLMQDLLVKNQRVTASLSSRQADIRRLQSDVDEIRNWADSPLPAGIIRLRQQPAIVGADAYSAAVPESDPVHPVRLVSED